MKTKGAPGWAKSKVGQHLQKRLNNEQTLRSIDHLLERMDTLENAVDRLATLMEQGPGMISMVTDMADETLKQSAAKGIYLEERLGNALHLAEKLTAPKMVDKIESMLEAVDKIPGMIRLRPGYQH